MLIKVKIQNKTILNMKIFKMIIIQRINLMMFQSL